MHSRSSFRALHLDSMISKGLFFQLEPLGRYFGNRKLIQNILWTDRRRIYLPTHFS